MECAIKFIDKCFMPQREQMGLNQEFFDRCYAVALASQQSGGDVGVINDVNHSPQSIATSRSGSKLASRCGSPVVVDSDSVVLNRFIHDIRIKPSKHMLSRAPSSTQFAIAKWHSDRSCEEGNDDEASSSRSSSNGSCTESTLFNTTLLARTFAKSRPENRASTYDLHKNRKALIGKYSGMPWVPVGKTYSIDSLGLHEDIVDFCHYMSPTEEERDIRMRVFHRLKVIIESVLSNVQLDFFGSFRTGLFLPTSDIDAVVFGSFPNHLPLMPISGALREHGVAVEGTIKVLDKASVPIIKYMDKETEIRVDISFNMTNGVKSAQLIQFYLSEYPPLRQLVYVLKYFLLERDLNEVFTGGVSSYSLILMVVSFLQTHTRKTRSVNYNLGELLLEFLELYGKKFNYFQTGIRVKEQGCYMAKEVLLKQMGDPHAPSILCIEDPLLPGNDIGRSSYGVMSVKEAFSYAYKTLCEALFHEVPPIFTENVSILGRVIQVTDAVVDYRNMLRQEWNQVQPAPEPLVSYAQVVVTGAARKCESETGKSGGDGDRPTSAEVFLASASCSELSSDAESDTSSHSSSSSSETSSRRSYSSVASSGISATCTPPVDDNKKPTSGKDDTSSQPLRPSKSYNNRNNRKNTKRSSFCHKSSNKRR